MTTYLLNSPVLTAYGEYSFTGPVTVAKARELLAEGFTSAIGHVSGAEFLTQLLNLPVPLNRIAIEMQPGDRAVVLRLKERLPENRSLSLDEVRLFPSELGLLTLHRSLNSAALTNQ